MSQRAVLGHHTKQPIAIVREHGSRVECVALVPWMFHEALEHIGDYWLGHFAPHATPESSALGWFNTISPPRSA